MPLETQGKVGPQFGLQPGTLADPRLGASAEAVVNELHGKFYEQNYRGSLFIASTPAAGVAIPIFSNAVQQFVVYNPPASGVNCVPIRLILGYVSAADVPGHLCIAHSLTAQTTPGTATAATIYNGRIGTPAAPGKVQVFSPATPATVLTYHSALDLSLETAVAASTNNMDKASIDFDGTYIAGPGSLWAIAGNVAQTRVSTVVLIFEEVPV